MIYCFCLLKISFCDRSVKDKSRSNNNNILTYIFSHFACNYTLLNYFFSQSSPSPIPSFISYMNSNIENGIRETSLFVQYARVQDYNVSSAHIRHQSKLILMPTSGPLMEKGSSVSSVEKNLHSKSLYF